MADVNVNGAAGKPRARSKTKPAAKVEAPHRISGVVDRHRFVSLWTEIAVFLTKAHDALGEVYDATRDHPRHPDRSWLDVEAVTDATHALDQLAALMANTPVRDIEGLLSSPVHWITTAGPERNDS
ncbi:MAG: hypothetical protein U0804_16000 [Gemmataceae bacterium]